MAKKVTTIVLKRYATQCDLVCEKSGRGTPWLCWTSFKRVNPVICKGLRRHKTRKLKRTQLINGFKLEIAKPET